MAVKTYRKRYILIKVHSNRETKKEVLETAILHSAKTLFGEINRPNMKLMNDFAKNNHFVLCVKHDDVQKAKLTLALIDKLEGNPVLLQSLKVFGTLKKIKHIFKEVV